MGLKLASELIADAAGLYNDPGFDRIDEGPGGDNAHNWLDLLNNGQSQLVVFRPQANVKNIVYRLVEGTKQKLPNGTDSFHGPARDGSVLTPENVCTDPDNDQDSASGWTPLGASVSSQIIPATGNYCLKVAASVGLGSAFNSLTLVKGKRYFFKCLMNAGLNEVAQVKLYYYKDALVIPEYDYQVIGTGLGVSWTEVVYEFTAQQSTQAYGDDDFKIELIAVGSSDIGYFDDVALYEAVAPNEGIQLINVIRNMGLTGVDPENAIQITDMETLNETVPGWHTQTGNRTVRNYCYDERDPDTFWVSPPQPATNQNYVEIAASLLPDEVAAAANPITLSDVFYHALVDYMLYKAYVLDSDNSQVALQKATAHWNLFVTAIDRKDLVNKMTDPNVKVSPAMQ